MSDQARAPRRRRIGISIRALMGVILVLAIGMGWWANKARRQRWAVEGLERVNGSIVYDHVYANGRYNYQAQPWGPRWLRQLLGDEYFQEVAEVNLLKGREVKDSDIAYLEGLPSVQRLYLRSTDITDDGLKHLSGLSHLRFLHIGDTKVGDAGLAHLKGLSRLEELIVEETEITDAGLVHLEGLGRLKTLNVRYTRVTDKGLSRLKHLDRLQELDVDESQATKALRNGVTGLPRLQKLDVVFGSYQTTRH